MRTNDSCGRLAKQADFLLLLRMELSRGVQEICNSQNSRVTRDETKDAPITLRPERAATEDGERAALRDNSRPAPFHSCCSTSEQWAIYDGGVVR